MYTRYSNSWLPVNADKSALCLWLWAVTRTESCHGNRGGPVLPPFMHVSHSPPRLHQQTPAGLLHPVPHPQPSLGTQRHHPAGECSVGCVTAAAAATAAAAVAAVSAAPKINRTRLQQGGASPPPPRDLHQVLKRTIQLGSALWGKGQRNICPQHACLLSVFNMLTLKACKTPCFPTHLDVVLHHVPQ
jgi:hypothetical protein